MNPVCTYGRGRFNWNSVYHVTYSFPTSAHHTKQLMADYWKSNPRKFCDVCKCWFGDNKASVEFHESGRRHQANVQKKLGQARIRSAENEKEKQNIAKTLHAIEHAALSAYQKDLAGGKVKNAKMPVVPVIVPEMNHAQQAQQYLAMDREKAERESEMKQIEQKAQEKIQEIQVKALETAYKAYSTSYVHSVSWQQCVTPEGYIYFYNTATGVTQWEVPPEFLPPPVPANFSAPGAPPPPVPGVSTAPATTTTTATTASSLKRPPEQAGLEERNTYQPAKRKGRPYGEWSTVAVIEKDDDELEDQGGDIEEATEEETTEDGIHFEEKIISEGATAETELKGDFKGFTFKKRTTKGRPKVRQRTSDV